MTSCAAADVALPGLILAAGFSRRMGRCKLTLPFGGEPLVRKVVRAAVNAGLSPVGVVVRPDATPELRAAVAGVDPAVHLVLAPDAYRGQSASLKAGIRWLLASVQAEIEAPARLPGVVVLLGDQPLVSPELIRLLRHVFRADPSRAVAPVFAGERGNPVILPQAAFEAVLRLSGDTGARGLLASFGLRLVPTGDRATVTDVDTWAAYQQLPSCPENEALPCYGMMPTQD